MDPRFEVLNNLPICDLSTDKTGSKVDIPQLMERFQRCIIPIVSRWRGNVAAVSDNRLTCELSNPSDKRKMGTDGCLRWTFSVPWHRSDGEPA